MGKNNDSDTIKDLNKLSLISENDMIQYGKNLECIDLSRIYQSFYLRVYGMKLSYKIKKKSI